MNAGYNKSTAALRVVKDDEKETWFLGVYLNNPVTGGHKYRDRSFSLGVGRKADSLAL
jgi:hypothetical protein